MKRAAASAFLFLFFLLSPLLAATKWTPIAQMLQESVVFIRTDTGACTGFVIDETKRHVLTAAHCDGEKLLADGVQTYKLFKDERKDLMVVRAPGLDKKALKLAHSNPERGDQVASMGYGFALEFPLFRLGYVSHTALEIEELSGPFIAIDATYVPGQSGGPVVNDAGEVVSIVQRSAPQFGIGVGAETIKDRVGRYFAK